MEQSKFHPRNKHAGSYDFSELIHICPELEQFVFVNQFGTTTIDFTNPRAVKILNRALLNHYYRISKWDIPEGYLCPPIPGRADYIHAIADILAGSNGGSIPIGKSVRVLDIGIGANCIYPLIGYGEYGWHFTGSELDPLAIKIAKQIIDSNQLSSHIKCRKQTNGDAIFKNIIGPGDRFDITMCNPPFHSSAEDARDGTERKWKNLKQNFSNKPVLNFGGQNTELWCKGGEREFIKRMVQESSNFKNNCLWFSTLVSKSENLPAIYSILKKLGPENIKTLAMSQGNKISRLVAWTFMNERQHLQWRLNYWKKDYANSETNTETRR